MTQSGFLGVDVFFVLSGFLITFLLLRERETTGEVSLKGFYVRRTLRIFPLYYAVLAALSVYFYLRGNPDFFARLPYDLSYTSNWTAQQSILDLTWSLSTEEQFYLLWPPLFVLLRRHAIAFLLAFLAFNELLNFRLIPGIAYDLYAILQVTFAPITLGALLAYYMQRPKWRINEAAMLIALAGSLLIANAGDMHGWPRLAFHLCTAVVIGGIFMNKDSLLVRILEWKPLAYVGVVSYGVYLLHKVGIDVAARVIPWKSETLLFAVSFAATVALAGISYRFFEKPILRLKSRYATAPTAAVPAQAILGTRQ